mmetsp:Transcript_254/g.244  ORF Transcript_254/g.244 Transcript_254/m.244 type:complete len:100 (-) Transcript_254:1204-1503(-)
MHRQSVRGLNSSSCIGQGGYGDVYKCFNETINDYCAVKLSKNKASLQQERDTILELNSEFEKAMGFVQGIPKFIEYGQKEPELDYMMISLHGKSVNKLK